MREKVAAIRDRLPEEIEDPTIVRFDVAALPIMTFAVGSSQRSDVTRRQVEDDLKPLLEQIDGVAAVEVNGGEVREIQVDLDPRRLEALGLPVSVVAEKLAAENLDLPGGQMQRARADASRCAPRASSRRRTRSRTSSCAPTAGSTVRVRDVGRVVDGFEERDVDHAPERRRRRLVLDQEAVGRQHRGDRRARARHARPRAPNFPALQHQRGA